MKKIIGTLLICTLFFGINYSSVNSVDAASCSGVNKVETNKNNVVQKQHIYLDSCNASEQAALVARKASDRSFMSGIAAFIPGFQPFSAMGLISGKMENNKSNDITVANSSGNGVVMKFEKDLNHKDTSHLWIYKGTESQ